MKISPAVSKTVVAIAGLTCVLHGIPPAGAQSQASRYQPTSESLRQHKVPGWFEDAKFGIFVHWGVYSVPAYHEWYVAFISPKAGFGFLFGGPPFNATRGNLPEELYKSRIVEDAVKYHIANWGADFPYDDFIPMFKAEKFDPSAWADLFRDAGARYVVLTAKHGDEFLRIAMLWRWGRIVT
jgi:alpha-L-fucosidase